MLKKIVGGVIVAVSLSALAAAGLSAQSAPFKPDTSRPRHHAGRIRALAERDLQLGPLGQRR